MKYIEIDSQGRMVSYGVTQPECLPYIARTGNSVVVDVDPPSDLNRHWEYKPNGSWVDHGPLNTPNYAELRRWEYPTLGDQFDAIWKLLGPSAPPGSEAAKLYGEILAVKNKHPKP